MKDVIEHFNTTFRKTLSVSDVMALFKQFNFTWTDQQPRMFQNIELFEKLLFFFRILCIKFNY